MIIKVVKNRALLAVVTRLQSLQRRLEELENSVHAKNQEVQNLTSRAQNLENAIQEHNLRIEQETLRLAELQRNNQLSAQQIQEKQEEIRHMQQNLEESENARLALLREQTQANEELLKREQQLQKIKQELTVAATKKPQEIPVPHLPDPTTVETSGFFSNWRGNDNIRDLSKYKLLEARGPRKQGRVRKACDLSCTPPSIVCLKLVQLDRAVLNRATWGSTLSQSIGYFWGSVSAPEPDPPELIAAQANVFRETMLLSKLASDNILKLTRLVKEPTAVSKIF